MKREDHESTQLMSGINIQKQHKYIEKAIAQGIENTIEGNRIRQFKRQIALTPTNPLLIWCGHANIGITITNPIQKKTNVLNAVP